MEEKKWSFCWSFNFCCKNITILLQVDKFEFSLKGAFHSFALVNLGKNVNN